MPQRVIGICTAAAGLLLVVFLILLRYDVRRAARTGSYWKRNLVLAGILILSSLGLFSTLAGGSGCATTTCYIGDYIPTPEEEERLDRIADVEKTLGRLSIRLDLLDRYAASEKLDRAVIEAVIANIKNDVATIEENIGLLPSVDREKARELCKRARLRLEAAEKRLTVSNINK